MWKIRAIEKILIWVRKFEYIFLLLIGFFLPLSKMILPYLITLAIIFWFIDKDLKKKLAGLRLEISFYPIIILFLLYVCGLIYTTNIDEGLMSIQVKLSIFFLPIVIFSNTLLNRQRLVSIYGAFIAGNILAVLICFAVAIIHSISLDGGRIIFDPYVYLDKVELSPIRLILKGYTYFNYSNFSIIHHPAYFSMYILFSIAILVSLWKEFPFIQKNLLKVLLIALFTIVIVLLSARAGIIAYIAVFIIYFGVYLKTRYPIYQRVFFILIILGGITFFALNNIRFQTIVKNQENETLYTRIKSDMRWQIWSSGIEVIRENPVFGVGTGDVTGELLKKYEERSLEEAYSRNMNVHNQFLETYLGLGVIGFLSLISMFVVPFIGRYQAF